MLEILEDIRWCIDKGHYFWIDEFKAEVSTITHIDPDLLNRLFMPIILSKKFVYPKIKNEKYCKIINECYMWDKWKYSFIFYDIKNQNNHYQIKDFFS